jgi:hypothetical protein
MSYCLSGEADAWLSTVNGTKFVSDDAIGLVPAADRPQASATGTLLARGGSQRAR